MSRAFLDSILGFIGSESLTDVEFDSLPEGLEIGYTQPVYLALKGVLEGRENVSGQGRKLKSYFVAKGVDLSGQNVHTPASNILIGKPL